jgi:cell division septum initiation protein DivIVA
VDVHEKLDEITSLVEQARAMPMSASCIVNRPELLTLLEELRALLPQEIDLAEQLLAGRDQVVEEGRVESDRIIAAAHEERMRLVSETEVFAQAQQEAARVVSEAHADAESMRKQVDEYVDGKLATFEITLNKTLSAVARGRDKLRGRGELEALGTLGTETGEIPAVRD